MVKYCQKCGNPSYDGATICGNCGSAFPPKSEINSKPPVFDTEKTEKLEDKTDFNLSESVNGLKSNLSKKFNTVNLNVDEVSKTITKKPEKAEKPKKPTLSESEKRETTIPTYTKSSVIGFKEKDKGSKDPARKFKTIPKIEEPIKEVPKKESKIKTKDDKEKINSINLPNINQSKINIKSVAIIAIVIIILIAIVGASIMSMSPNTGSNETLYFSDGPMGFYYPGSWSMYNNSGDNGGEIAFKTPDKVLVGYTKIVNDQLTLDTVTAEINATAQSLGGTITQYKDITVDGIPATDITISSADHGYSRYISIIHNGVYYSFVINTGQTSNPNDASSLTNSDIQTMIQSIKFSDLNQTTTTQV